MKRRRMKVMQAVGNVAPPDGQILDRRKIADWLRQYVLHAGQSRLLIRGRSWCEDTGDLGDGPVLWKWGVK